MIPSAGASRAHAVESDDAGSDGGSPAVGPGRTSGAIVLLTLKEVLDQLKGKVGRDKLLDHLARVPRWGDGPTHLRNGRKYLFRLEDIQRLLASFESPRERHRSFYPGVAVPSAEQSMKRARGLVASSDAKAKTRRRGEPTKSKGAVATMPTDR